MKAPLSTGRKILAAVLVVGGIGSGVLVLLLWGFGVFASLLRVDAPGTAETELEPGHYTIWWEGTMSSKQNAKPPGVGVEIESVPDGGAIAVSGQDHWNISYHTLDGHQGTSIAGFSVPQKGRYRIKVLEPRPKQQRPSQVSLTKALGVAALLRVAALPFCLFWGGILAGAYVLIQRPKAA